MKAIRKSDGKIIDVEVHGWNGGCPISYHTDFKDFYKPEDLDFNVVETEPEDYCSSISKVFDWQSFRNQAAKDILCALIPFGKDEGLTKEETLEYCVKNAVFIADKLITKLKEEE